MGLQSEVFTNENLAEEIQPPNDFIRSYEQNAYPEIPTMGDLVTKKHKDWYQHKR